MHSYIKASFENITKKYIKFQREIFDCLIEDVIANYRGIWMIEWWERLNLSDNPFEKVKGISPTDLNDLLVKTSTITKYEKRLQNQTTLFNRTFLIFGEFGSGKTTLFQFIRSRLFGSDIFCRIIRLNGTFADSSDLENHFRTKLYRCLTGETRNIVQDYEIEQAFLDKMENNITKGFFLILDELHKNPNYDISLEFLKNMQGSFEGYFDKIKVGLIIAGRDEWRTRIEESGEYSGTVDVTDEMAPLTPQDAYQIIIRRLEKYAEDRQKASDLITKDAVEKILFMLRKKTPRHLIKTVRESFERLPEDRTTLDLTDIEKGIHHSTLTAIKNRLHGESRVHRPLLRTIEKFKPPSELQRSLTVICNFYHRDPLPEPLTDESLREVGVENDEIILSLLSMEILTKNVASVRTKSKNGTTIKEKTTINLSKYFRNIFDSISARHNVAPEDYLYRLYGPSKPPKKKPAKKRKKKEEIIQRMQLINERLAFSLKLNKGANHMLRCIESYETVSGYVKKPTKRFRPMDALGVAYDSLYGALYAKLIYKTKNNDESREEQELFADAIKDYTDELSEFYINYRIIRGEGTPITNEELYELLDLYKSAIKDIISLFEEDIKLDRYFKIDSPQLTDSDKKLLRRIRRIYDERKIKSVASDLIGYFEPKVREFIKNSLERVYGKKWFKEGLTNDVYTEIQTKIAKERENPDYKLAENPLDYANFMELGKIIEWKKNWGSIFEHYFGHGKRDDFKVKWKEINDLARTPMAHFRLESTREEPQILQAIINVRWMLIHINQEVKIQSGN